MGMGTETTEWGRWPTPQRKKWIFELLGYKPHPGQWAAHCSTARVIMACGGQRSGKSYWSSMEVVSRVPWSRRIAVAAQSYSETRKEMQVIMDSLRRLGGLVVESQPVQGPWYCKAALNGCEIESVSLQEGPDKLTGTGEAYDIVLLVEAGRIAYNAFLAARGRVAEPRGDVLLSGTLWDNWGWYADLYRAFEGPNEFEGERFQFPMWMNTAIFPGGRDDPEIKHLEAILPDEEFARLVAAELKASPARMYPEFEYGVHVQEVGFNPDLPVELAVDAGYYPSYYAVLAIQVLPVQVEMETGSVFTWDVPTVVDEIYEQRQTHHDIVDLCRYREWWPNVTRAVGGHETGQHPASKSTQEVWQELVGQEDGDPQDFRFDICDAGAVQDGITRMHTLLLDPGVKEPRIQVAPACMGLLQEFQSYKRRTNRRGDVVSEEPEDKNNDALDALRNWAVDRYGFVDTDREPVPGRKRGRMRG